MEEDFKRKKWSVTYTKHLKQKRKIYQDGSLHLHSITNKVTLFDDCQNLLECRILKDEEIVAPGQTLSFNAFLVEVGDPDGGDDDKHTAVPGMKTHGKDVKITSIPRPSLSRRKKFRSPSISCEAGKDNEEKSYKSKLSPSQKVIREFKRSELQKYGTPHGSSDMLTLLTEWQVLYTTQMIQRAKKFHDGFLQLSHCGSTGRQVMLYDAGRKLLTSRFLKRDEIVGCGEAISFDGHLVEIGELVGDHKPFMDLTNEGNNDNIVGKTKTVHGHESRFKSTIFVEEEFKENHAHECDMPQDGAAVTKSNRTEWQVTYTTQMTQKTKKYHDGFLRLANCGSLGRKIILCDANKKVLDSRFLKKSEIIRSGESIAFDAHLVDIGEPERLNQLIEDFGVRGTNSDHVGKAGRKQAHENFLTANRSVANNIPSKDRTKLSNTVPASKPLRDAHQILSVLQKPIAQESVVARGTAKSVVEPAFSITGLKGSYADMGSPQDCQRPGDSNHLQRETLDIGGSAKGTYSSIEFYEDAEGLSEQCHLDNVGDTKGTDEHFAPDNSSSPNVPHGPFDDERKTFEHIKGKIEKWPTFDLGF